MRPLPLAAVATAVLAAVPGTAAAELPRVTLSGRVFERHAVVEVSGRGCRHTGLGNGYLIDLESGVRRTLSEDGEDAKPDGTWKARVSMPTTAARYRLIARCLEKKMMGDDYPAETLTVLPQRNPVAEGTLTVSPAVASPGDTVRVSGRIDAPEFAPGVFLVASRTYLGPMTLASDLKSASGSVRLPRDLAPGTHRLVAQTDGRDNGDGVIAYIGTVRVVADEPSPVATTTTPPPATPSPTPTPSPTSESPEPTVEASSDAPSPQPTAVLTVHDGGDGLGAGTVAAAGGAAALAMAGGALVVRRRRRA